MDLPVISRVLYQSKLRARLAGDLGAHYKRFDTGGARRSPHRVMDPARCGEPMAAKTLQASTNAPTLSRDGSRRLVILLIGVALVIGAFVAPWWTRGLTLNHDCAYGSPQDQATACPQSNSRNSGLNSGLTIPGSEGLYLNYGPFHTPSLLGAGTDASRDTATSVLGIGAVLATLFLGASLALRALAGMGRISAHPSVAVRFAIAAVGAGIFTVLWATFFLPLFGNGSGMLWGHNFNYDFGSNVVYDSRYANVGYFLGIIAFVGVPVYAWVDASQARMAAWAAANWVPGQAAAEPSVA